MFEKEAEERARELEESQTLGVYDNEEDYARDVGWNDGKVVGYEQGFQEGAEFVYNKYNAKLTKAKEIIKKLYSHVFQGMGFMEINDYNVQKAELEQFIKE